MKNNNLTGLAAILVVTGAAVFIALRQAPDVKEGDFLREIPAQCNPDNPFAYPLDSLSAIDASRIGYLQTDSVTLLLDDPRTLCIDGNDRRYVAAAGGVFLVDESGNGAGVIAYGEAVVAVTTGPGGTLYAATQRKLLRRNDGGTSSLTWSAGSEKTFITSIAADEAFIYVADAGERLVWCLDTAGAVINRIGLKDSARGIPGFVVPSPYMDCAPGQDGSLWVVNPGRHSVENYRRNGDLLSSWGRPGTDLEGFCGCCNPVHIALMPDGSFVTVEKGIVRVKVYGPAGTFTTAVAAQTAFSPNITGLVPAVDSQGRIYILDRHAALLRIFTGKPGSAENAS